MKQNKSTNKFLALSLCNLLLIFLTLLDLQAGESEKYPVRPVTMTVSYAPGGVADLTARSICHTASKYFEQPIVTMNKPGGGGLIGLQNLLTLKADGYTFHFASTGELSIAPFVERFPFKMEEDFQPVAQINSSPMIISVAKESPWNNIEEMVVVVKGQPGKISFACASPTATTRFGMEKFCYEAGVKLNCVPFKGGAPAALAVVGGHVPVLVSTTVEALPHIERGDLRVLLTLGPIRLKRFPGVPTALEKGFNVNMLAIGAVIAKRGTPPGIIAKFESLMANVTKDNDFVSTMTKLGVDTEFRSGQEYAKYWAEERKWIGAIVDKIGLGQKQ
jgi:tripartite-type tricarboxylate transporter receptor subunit TctC